MAKTYKYLIIAGVVLIVLLWGYKSCNLYDQNSVLKGKYDVLLKLSKDAKANYEEQIKLRDEKITELDKGIESAKESISKKEHSIAESDSQLTKLSNELEKNKHKSEELIGTWKERVKILNATVSELEKKFSVAQNIIADKDKIIFSLKEKYDTQLKLTVNLQELVNKEHALRLTGDKRIKLLEQKVRLNLFTGKLKSGIIVAAGAFLVYSMVKK